MNTTDKGWTTSSINVTPLGDARPDPTPGLVLVYSNLHKHLPSAVALSTSSTTIGREADNVLSIPEAAVSRYHARFEEREDGMWVVDAGSTNGTLVNGARVTEHRLEAHDLVRVGDTIFRYASEAIYRYGAYRVDGSIIETTRPFHHTVREPKLIGGLQIDALLERIDKVSRTELSVVITGESGTGKELVAKQVHVSSRRKGPFQAINCAALPANLIESELFGYRRGAFTGAHADKKGLIEAANGGSVFLDEIGDMPLEAQAKLLRVVQEREVVPIGATAAVPVDVRIISATHRDLDARVQDESFRGDLLGRIREFSVQLPPLRLRREDLHPLVRHFLEKSGRPETEVRFPFMLALAHYGFPYNVRELESAVKLALALSEGAPLDILHLPPTIQHALEGHGRPRSRPRMDPTGPVTTIPQATPMAPPRRPTPSGRSTPRRRRVPEEAELRAALSRHHGNIAAVGREYGKERMQIHRWLKRYDIDVEDYRT